MATNKHSKLSKSSKTMKNVWLQMKCKMAADQVLKRFSRQIRKEDAFKCFPSVSRGIAELKIPALCKAFHNRKNWPCQFTGTTATPGTGPTRHHPDNYIRYHDPNAVGPAKNIRVSRGQSSAERGSQAASGDMVVYCTRWIRSVSMQTRQICSQVQHQRGEFLVLQVVGRKLTDFAVKDEVVSPFQFSMTLRPSWNGTRLHPVREERSMESIRWARTS
jgi:hypothetical protein